MRALGEIQFLCLSNNLIIQRSVSTLTINGQNIGGFSRGALLDDFSLRFVNFELSADTDQRVAQCHFGDFHSNPYVIDIVDVASDCELNELGNVGLAP